MSLLSSTVSDSGCFFQFSRPEFVLLAGEAPVTLHLPGSIVVTAGLDWAGVGGDGAMTGVLGWDGPRGALCPPDCCQSPLPSHTPAPCPSALPCTL